MLEEIGTAGEVLANTKAGWVNRRDAAELLSDAACRALSALHTHHQDPDRDVRDAVQKGLAKAVAATAGVRPEGGHSLAELARACAKPGEREVSPHGDGYDIEVHLKNDRHQCVHLIPFTRKDRTRLVRIFTHCGKPKADSLSWALQANMKLTHGALALDGEGDNARFVLVNCYLAEAATLAEVKASVKEIASFGDWLEEKLTGLDEV